MLVVDCRDDCLGPKPFSRCLPATVHRGGWRLVDIIVVGCYACTTQLKIVIFLKIGCFGLLKALLCPVSFSSMGSKTTSSSKKSKYKNGRKSKN